MKQLILVGMLTLIGTVGTFTIAPFCSVAVYYIFAVLRPQSIWEWSLPPGVAWSRYVALSAIAAAFLVKAGVLPGGRPTDDVRNPAAKGHSPALAVTYFFWILVTYAMARDRETSEPYVIDYLKIFAMLAASTILIRTTWELWTLLVSAGLCLGYIAFEVNSLYFSTGTIAIVRNGYSGLDNNGAGLMLAMGLPICLAIWDGMRSRWRWIFLAMVPVIAHAVMMTYSRGAMLSLIVVSPLMLVRARRRLQLIGFGLLFVTLALPTLAGPEIRKRFFTINEVEKDDSAKARFGSWSAAWAMACDHPVFGVGVRNANLFSFQYGALNEGQTIHSQYLQILADNGFPGLGLYLALLASVFLDLRRVRLATRKRDDPESRRAYAIASGSEASLVTVCFGGIFLSLETFELPYLLMLLAWKSAEVVPARTPPGRLAGAGRP